ncbi:SGNH/GDSL hydrolase family protein [Flavobacteriaceae bacterium]|nr:SGNH/GDSL hydrolase family protein [Flavobacteriaceae bacterium]
MNIITILGDSLSMARIEDGISYKDTYSYLLSEYLKKDYLVLNKSKRGNTTKNQINPQNIYDDIITTNSNFFIIQIGIVDCSPRIITMKEKVILRYLFSEKIQNIYIGFKSKYRRFITRNFPKTYVSLDNFNDNYKLLIQTILKQTAVKKIVLINISDTNNINKYRSYGFENNIISYNQVISKLQKKFKSKVELIDLFSISKNNNIILDDGIHISPDAHIVLANEIKKVLFYS